MKWRPIKTVPHIDGTTVLLLAAGSGVGVWTWHEHDQRWHSGGLWWQEGDLGPTHWLPIDAPPPDELPNRP